MSLLVKLSLKQENSNIALTGLMGSGKTTVGKYLAQQLKKKFIDTDTLIEERAGTSINNIFKDKGEDYFRELEKQVIQEVFQGEDQIVSLGGGAIVNSENRELVKANATLIALIADPHELHDRVKRRKNRPLLAQNKDQVSVLEKLWEERKDAYYDSHYQVDTAKKSINMISLEIMRILGYKKPRVQEQTIKIKRTNFSYKIFYKDLDRLNFDYLEAGKKVLIISQEPIAKHYLRNLREKLEQNHSVETVIIKDGEDAKNFFTYQSILQKLLSLNFSRKDTLIALGGGVVGDISGFAASTYYRGINFIQVPTTLLAMIDSSVGGKTGINVPEGKNLIGSFYQPHMVHIDASTLVTLSEKEFKSGLGELVKYTLLGAKWDEELGDSFFNFVSGHLDEIIEKDPDTLIQIINHCLVIKAGIVSEDETEQGIRAHLNLGHTFAHALEEITKYERFSHGEAVTIGIVCACYLSEELHYFKSHQTKAVIDLISKLGLEYRIPKEIETMRIIESFKYDKKNEKGSTRFVIPKSHIGKVELVSTVAEELIINAIERNRKA